MNQTNGVSGSRKPIRHEPNSRTPQPDATRSAKHPLNEALDKQFPKPKPVTTLEEAQEVLRKCQECVTNVQSYETNVRSATDTLRWVVYQAYLQDVPKLVGMNKREFRLKVASVATKNSYRSTISRSSISRVCLAARMEAELEIPFGEMKESAFRTLRIKVPKNKCGDVLAHALEEKGSYQKITAVDMEAAARELGCLKTPSDNPDETNNHEDAVRVWLQEHSKHQDALQRLLKKLDIQPALIQQVTALVKQQRQQLDDLLKKAIG